MSKAKLYVAALAAALIAANSVLHLVSGDVISGVLSVLAGVGLYVAPSPILSHKE